MYNIIRQVLYEYLTKNASAVKRDLTNSVKNADEFDYEARYRQPTGKIIKNQWLFHGTKFKNALGILKNGFKGYNNLVNVGLTAGHARQNGSVAFAFPLDRSEDIDNGIVRHVMHYSSEVILVFQANGFEDYYEPNKKNEILFDINSVHNLFLVFRFQLQFGQYGYSIPLKNGRFITFKSDVYLSDNKLYDWVKNNYMTYKNAIKTDFTKLPTDYFNKVRKQEYDDKFKSLPQKRKFNKNNVNYLTNAKNYRNELYDQFYKALEQQGETDPEMINLYKKYKIGRAKYYNFYKHNKNK